MQLAPAPTLPEAARLLLLLPTKGPLRCHPPQIGPRTRQRQPPVLPPWCTPSATTTCRPKSPPPAPRKCLPRRWHKRLKPFEPRKEQRRRRLETARHLWHRQQLLPTLRRPRRLPLRTSMVNRLALLANPHPLLLRLLSPPLLPLPPPLPLLLPVVVVLVLRQRRRLVLFPYGSLNKPNPSFPIMWWNRWSGCRGCSAYSATQTSGSYCRQPPLPPKNSIR